MRVLRVAILYILPLLIFSCANENNDEDLLSPGGFSYDCIQLNDEAHELFHEWNSNEKEDTFEFCIRRLDSAISCDETYFYPYYAKANFLKIKEEYEKSNDVYFEIIRLFGSNKEWVYAYVSDNYVGLNDSLSVKKYADFSMDEAKTQFKDSDSSVSLENLIILTAKFISVPDSKNILLENEDYFSEQDLIRIDRMIQYFQKDNKN